MTKLLKNGKSIFAFVMAFAIIAVSLFTGVAINADAATTQTVLYWDGTTKTEPKTTDDDGNYIITSPAELAYIVANPTTNKNYKVQDGIKAFVLQPENVKDVANLLNYTNYTDVKTYFEANSSSLKKWSNKDQQTSAFQGTFDGNGVTIYGLYSEVGEAGLFSWVNAGTTFKNIAIKNSYVKSNSDGAGVFFARIANNVSSGMVNFKNCEVSGCYVESTTTNKGRTGVLFGFNMLNNIGVAMNELFVYNNYANDPAGACGLYGMVSNGYNGEGTETPNINLFDSIVLGCLPYSVVQNNQATRLTYYGKIYTDTYTPSLGSLSAWYNDSDYADKIFVIDGDDVFEGDAQEVLSKLDYTNSWVSTEIGPQLSAFHGEFKLVQTNDTHYYACDHCGLKSYGGAKAHEWVNGVCSDSKCGYKCTHKEQDVEMTDGDCVTKATVKTKCKICGYTTIEKIGEIKGHDLEWIAPNASLCGESATKGYWYCKECDKYFSGEDEESVRFAKISTAVAGPQGHKIVKVEEVAATDKLEGTKAHYECEVCHEMYIDAEGKTKALAADLVIPKATPTGFAALLGGKSPATGESIAIAVASVAALVCAAFVILRKARKYN